MKFRVATFLLILFFAAMPKANADHDTNDFFVADSQNGTPTSQLRGQSSNMWGVPTFPAVAPATVYRRVSTGVWQSIPHGLLVGGDPFGGGELSVLDSTHVWYIDGTDPICNPNTGQQVPARDSENDYSFWGGSSFTPAIIPTMSFSRGLVAITSSNVWVTGIRLDDTNCVGSSKSIASQWNGATWTTTDISATFGAQDPPQKLFALSASDIWGLSGGPGAVRLAHYDGVSWAYSGVTMAGATEGIQRTFDTRLWASSSSNIYVILGNHIYRTINQGASWTTLVTAAAPFTAISGTSGGVIWATSGQVLYHSSDGTTFSTINPTSPLTTEIIHAVLAHSNTDVYVGLGGSASAEPGIFHLQTNSAFGPISLIGMTFDITELFVTVSQAQCNLDHQSAVVNVGVTQTLNDMDLYIYKAVDHVFVLQFDDSAMFHDPSTGASGVYGIDFQLPTGTYVALVTSDFGGLGAVDFFFGTAFNVPRGTCVDSTNQDLLPFLINQFQQTNTYENSTEAANHFEHTQTNSYINSTHSHIDSHFNSTNALIIYRTSQTNSYVNLTRQDIANLSAQVANINVTLTGNVSINTTEIENVILASMNPIADSLDIIFWVLLVAVTYLCASSQKLPLVITAVPLGIFVVLYGIYIFENQAFDIAALATGVILGATIFGWKDRQQIDEKREKQNVD